MTRIRYRYTANRRLPQSIDYENLGYIVSADAIVGHLIAHSQITPKYGNASYKHLYGMEELKHAIHYDFVAKRSPDHHIQLTIAAPIIETIIYGIASYSSTFVGRVINDIYNIFINQYKQFDYRYE